MHHRYLLLCGILYDLPLVQEKELSWMLVELSQNIKMIKMIKNG